MSECPFCKRIDSGDYDDWLKRFDAVTFEPLNPVTPGHRLVIPRIHVPSALGHPAIAADTMAAAVVTATRYEVGDCNFITSAGPAATQTIRHLHIHVVPRRDDDGLHLPWTGHAKLARSRASALASGPDSTGAVSSGTGTSGEHTEPRSRAVTLLAEALSLRASPPESRAAAIAAWRYWDRRVEAYLRSLAPGEQP